jgi:acetoacetyl-CoA synthetase
MPHYAEPLAVREGTLLWSPTPERCASTNLAHYQAWLAAERGLRFDDYHSLWHWSQSEIEQFWQSIWDYFKLDATHPPRKVLEDRRMPGARWFPGSRLNFAAHVLRNESPGTSALLHANETLDLESIAWPEFARQVRRCAAGLRAAGVVPGDRLLAYLPNIPEALVAMLATTAIGAVWVCCAPEFGARGCLDRVAQLAPRVLICVDGYRYGGRRFDRRADVRAIIAGLGSLCLVVQLPYLDPAAPPPCANATSWSDFLGPYRGDPADFRCEPVPFDHPLWILFSSGTTGLPKAIVHGHGGMLLEMYKLVHLQLDLRAGERLFFYTTTGWMMWNFLVGSLLCGCCPVLYDGHPSQPEIDVLWRLVAASEAVLFGASPSYVDLLDKAGVVPRQRHDLSRLRTIFPAGSPVTAAHTAWFYANVKTDLWVATGSGGTDCCTGFVGGVPTQPVYAGEIQAPSLGVAVRAYDAEGRSIVEEVGELVIVEPMPSMPLSLWNDPGDARYRESYFNVYPGVWRHGDFFKINARGGCFVLGRSDATLNRYGVRIGTAEIYRALADIDGLLDALIVNLDLPGGRFFMPLFITLDSAVRFDEPLRETIVERLRREYTPRHVPDRIIVVPDIPVTRTGKKMEVPVRRILMGVAPEQAANKDAMANPESLEWFVNYARTQQDYKFDLPAVAGSRDKEKS